MRRHILYPRGFQSISSAFGIVILVFIWILFAPAQVGGLASYVIVIGSSMEPNFHIGDLVIAQKQPGYQIGDAVVYRNIDLQGFVFHRIIDEEMGRFTLQGDNNSWTDTYQPTKEEVIGKLWLHIPRGGFAMQKVRSPWMMALIAASLGLLVANNLFSNKTKGNKHMSKKTIREWFVSFKQKTQSWFAQINSSEPRQPSGLNQGGALEGSFFVLGLVLLSSLILGFVSFSRPTFRLASDDVQYQHLGIFSYMTSAPQSVYDSNTIKSGDPIFPRLTCAVDVNLQYTLIASGADQLTGTYQLSAVIQEQTSGWQREIPLQEETSFSGSSFGTTARLDLCKVESLTESMETETDFHPGSYVLVISPNVKINGELSGHPLEANFDSGLTFLYDHIHFYLLQDKEIESPLSITETGTIHEQRRDTNTVAFLNTEISVPALRWMALAGLLFSMAGFILLGIRLQTLSHTDQVRFFRVKYDSITVDVHTMDVPAANCVIVASMDALAKLAERFNAIILHVEHGNLHRYYVQAGGTTYQFEIASNATESTVPEHEAPRQEGES